MRSACAIFLEFVWLSMALAGEPDTKPSQEFWDAAYLNGQRAGFSHSMVVEVTRDGWQALRVTQELRLTIKSNQTLAQVRDERGNEETRDGKLLSVFRTMDRAGGPIKLRGRVVDGVLEDSIEDPNIPKVNWPRRSIPLPDDFVTVLGERALLKKAGLKPGDRISYRLFEATINNVIRVEAEAKGYDVLPLDGVNRKLLRVVAKPMKIGELQLPSKTIWYDEEFAPLQSQVEMNLGELTLQRTSKEKALASTGKIGEMKDASIVLDRTIPNAPQLGKIVYRVVFTKEMDSLERAFATGDNRQSVSVTGNALELVVSSVRNPPRSRSGDTVAAEYVDSNFFVNCADSEVRKLAAGAVGDESDPWKKAQLIEKWVKRHIQTAVTDAPSPADRVARTLRGDCKDVAVLTAAMCRAQKIPSRTAIGLIYVVDRGQAKLVGHMWTEVWINGQWLGLDAIKGLGSVGPDHIKVTDHSWKDTYSIAPMLPLVRLTTGRPSVEVMRVDREGAENGNRSRD